MPARTHTARRIVGVLAVAMLGVAACTATPSPSQAEPTAIPDWREDPFEPYPFGGDAPALEPTPVDGIFRRAEATDTYTGDLPHCRRCPAYPLDAGLSWLTLDRGRFLVVHEEPAFVATGHYVVEADRLTLFNDASCQTDRGTYRWQIDEDGTLALEVTDDPCGSGLRLDDLTASAWHPVDPREAGCEPPDVEAAISDHWLRGPACRE